MQRKFGWVVGMVVLGLAACGRGSGAKAVAYGDPPPTQDDGRDGTTPAGCQDVTVRLLGVAQGDVTAAHLVVGAISAKLVASGDPLALASVQPGATIDLSTDLRSAALGTFRLADATGPVELALSFSGGHAARAAVDGALEVCTAPIAFRLDPAQVHAERCHVLVKLDVGRSVLATAGALSFLPQFAVAF